MHLTMAQLKKKESKELTENMVQAQPSFITSISPGLASKCTQEAMYFKK